MYAAKDPSVSPSDILLKMVDEIAAKYSGSADQLEQMEQLERALSLLVEDEKKAKQPRPPTIPPPLDSLGVGLPQNNDYDDDDSLAKAEQALQKLRQRLKEEEESLRRAEEALARSREEDETLRKAEEALQRSREEAEKRKAQAIRQTEQAVTSAKKTHEETQRAKQITEEISASQKSKDKPRATIAIQKPRATISLLSFFGKKDALLDEDELVNDDASTNYEPSQKIDQAPPGVPILYDWVQYIDGSISGRVKGSKSFTDGSSVSTSPIEVRAKFGSVVTTSSGNK
jgi:tetratricopeptide (TPR) repeat protein